jgi:hypothetical protein
MIPAPLTLSDGNRFGIRRMVDRLHVSTSNRAIVRDLYQRMRKATRRRRKADRVAWPSRAFRREAYLCALDAHKANRNLYRNVMSGSF